MGSALGRAQYKQKKMMRSQLVTLAALLSLAGCKPQYGAVQPGHVKPASLTGSVRCHTEYTTLWDTEYKETETEVCTTEYEKVCQTETQRLCRATTRQECSTEYEEECRTEYRTVCVQQQRTEYEPYTETECSTEYKEDCEYQWEGQGNDKVWAPIPGTCKNNPYQTCKDVAKTKAVQVEYPVCRDVPEQKCQTVPRQKCVTVPDQVCTNQPLQKCKDVPRQSCNNIHKKVPVRVSKRVPRRVCEDAPSNIVPATPISPVAPFSPEAEDFDVVSTDNSGPEIVDVRHKTGGSGDAVVFVV